MKRVLCPFHKERTPSCILYSDHYYCYSCQKTGPLTEIAGAELLDVSDPEPENLEASLAYIDTLPLKEVRGLLLPSDEDAFYVVWPNRLYYKKRLYRPGKAKYLGAAGHKKPLFAANMAGSQTLIVVEGELNALSLAKALPELDVISPGGVGDFTVSRIRKSYTIYDSYSIIVGIADRDGPGAEALINLRAALRKKPVITHLMQPDANEILQERGSEGLREEISKVLGAALEARAR